MPSAEPNLDTRERVLEAAMNVFAERGFAGTSTREVCARASVNSAALNYHWGSKDRLWTAVVERAASSFDAVVRDNLDLSLPPVELFERVIGALFDAVAEDPRSIRLVLWATMQSEALDYEATARAFDPIVETSVQTLRAMQAAGHLDPSLDVEVIIPLLHGQMVYAFADRAGHRRFYGVDLSDPAHAARFRAQLLRSVRLLLGVGES